MAGMTTEPEPTSASLRTGQAAELFRQIPELAQDMAARPAPDEGALAFTTRLLTSPAPEEAVTFAAQVFTRRVALWWGHECLRHLDACLDSTDRKMMAHVADWVAQPDEMNRLAAAEAAAAAPQRSPGVWLAMATGWAGGSLTPDDTVPVPPPRFLTGRGVNAAVLSALARGPRKDRQGTLETFVIMMRDLA